MLKEAQIPDTGINAHNFFFKNDKWNLYKDKLNEIDKQQVDNSFLSFHEIIIPTIDSLKNNQIFEICMQNRIPTLFIGPTGTGKTVMIQNHIKSISHELYQTISVGFSA
jgi:dynein heavy chain